MSSATWVSCALVALLLPGVGQESRSDGERVEAIVMESMGGPGAVGLSVAVGRGGEVFYEKAHGFADLEFGVEADAQTMFRIGSVTKQFTAAAILVLAEQDKLSIDDPLTDFLPDYAGRGDEITLRHLLSHTGGVPNYTALGPVWEVNKARELPDEELVTLWQNLPLDFEPGERWNYSNSGYYLLGMVIARVSGKSYAEFVRETLFEPLHLTRTLYDSNERVLLNRAQGYAFVDGEFQNDELLGMSQPGAAGALISTAGDLVRWQQALVAGRVVPPERYEEMTLPFLLNSGRETNYGLGLQMDESHGHRRISHGGGINGFNSVLMYFPETRLHVAVISNGEALSAGRVGDAIATELLGEK